MTKFKFSFQVDANLCMSCATCVLECPDKAIYEDGGVTYAINDGLCRRCSRCFRACPTNAIQKITNQ